MFKRLFIFILLIGLGYIFFSLAKDYQGKTELSGIGRYYAEKGADELGSANLVTAIVVTYRGLDTLGEVSILFLTALIIGFVLSGKASPEKYKFNPASEILTTALKMMVPIVFMFGVYVFMNGHLSPGGGFQGGAIIASGVALLLLSQPDKKINHRLISVIESISGTSFVIVGILGILLAGGFLDNRIMELGSFGHILSAGSIPIIYIFIGLKVGAELTSILSNLQETQTQE